MEISFYNHWLDNGQVYADGLAFYIKHGTNGALKRLFSVGENPWNKTKLESELEKLQHIPHVVAKINNRVKVKIDRSKLPQHLQTEYDKLPELIGTMSFKHAQLEVVHHDVERHTLAKEIMAAAEERRWIFNRIDNYLVTGKDLVPDPIAIKEPEEKSLLVLQLENQLRLLRAQRSKLKTNKKRVADYNSVLERIVEIERRLKDAV